MRDYSLIFWEHVVSLLNHLYLQKVKVNVLDKAVLVKAGLAVALEFRDGGIQPDGPAQIPGIADSLQRLKNFVGAGVLRVVGHSHIFDQMIILDDFSPKSKHSGLLSLGRAVSCTVFEISEKLFLSVFHVVLVTVHELVNTSGCIYQCRFTCIERVRSVRDFDFQ